MNKPIHSCSVLEMKPVLVEVPELVLANSNEQALLFSYFLLFFIQAKRTYRWVVHPNAWQVYCMISLLLGMKSTILLHMRAKIF